MVTHTRSHPLLSPSLGTQRQLVSVHYGREGTGPKAYLQASLHADELPGMLVLHHLRKLLDRADEAGEVRGEIVLVPLANPIGLAQRVLHEPGGRFELAGGENFNRRFPDYYPLVRDAVAPLLTADANANRTVVRAALRDALAAVAPESELASLRHTLATLALDSDLVLDLHCDREAVLHLYTDEPFWPAFEPLARDLGVALTVLGRGHGGTTFEESCGQAWWRLAHEFGPAVPHGCMSATVELRGQRDLRHDQAIKDALAIYAFLQRRGHLAGEAPPLPLPVDAPRYWEGMISATAPQAGLVVYTRDVGEHVEAGDTIAEIVDPLDNRVVPVVSRIAGMLYARHLQRYAQPGMELCRVVGEAAVAEAPVVLA
ncbi:M14 family metallopeptidase [Crenobacter sp. SG2303]|uniref:M14 family metallopeptidase n=1 Tax=Crenobacter oryzisoli TaxID=3056844 RepID=A0ABT7XIZ8_9NEIS|nr:succinylglutamate desuccinylase/aspartoacylase family protein [Crenobacter sp. SG2303]MDN0073767.1 M14 family metallopeptidase [Crenobacter sp. SG2303]